MQLQQRHETAVSCVDVPGLHQPAHTKTLRYSVRESLLSQHHVTCSTDTLPILVPAAVLRTRLKGKLLNKQKQMKPLKAKSDTVAWRRSSAFFAIYWSPWTCSPPSLSAVQTDSINFFWRTISAGGKRTFGLSEPAQLVDVRLIHVLLQAFYALDHCGDTHSTLSPTLPNNSWT